ncbi:hypothetical protein [Luteimonas wenzhouensis]|jgi:hypothetical protein|uniref:DNA-binding protein n=1 Tax=Luteimonas wenzhouensis TaxID=2599615 RepID=A0A5C5TX41_9GAMM|nr:hypothetical protein [Luteimonas wenzhouensis]NLW96253.1 hypothetical protein [Xanthomonadaceae bacterium]TWT17998.1 hypothetical protein FQY79_11865 [Luteimonas wenzhouensis]
MTIRTTRILVALLAASCVSAAAAQSVIRPEHAVRHAGQTGMVCGKVEKTRYAENSEGQPTFLHMGGMFPRHTFSARIPQELRGRFRPTPEELEGRDVCVIGTIQRDASRAEIAIASPNDVKLATIE